MDQVEVYYSGASNLIIFQLTCVVWYESKKKVTQALYSSTQSSRYSSWTTTSRYKWCYKRKIRLGRPIYYLAQIYGVFLNYGNHTLNPSFPHLSFILYILLHSSNSVVIPISSHFSFYSLQSNLLNLFLVVSPLLIGITYYLYL